MEDEKDPWRGTSWEDPNKRNPFEGTVWERENLPRNRESEDVSSSYTSDRNSYQSSGGNTGCAVLLFPFFGSIGLGIYWLVS